MSEPAKKSQREIWDEAVKQGKQEKRIELKADREEIRRVLRESRWQHTRRVRTVLP